MRFVGVIHYLIIVVLIGTSLIIRLLMLIVLFIIFLIIVLLSDMLSGHNANKPHSHEHAIIWLSPIALGHLIIVLFVIFFVVLVHCLVVHTKPSDSSSVIWDDVGCLKVHWLRHIGSSH